jgi:hypothetical protein
MTDAPRKLAIEEDVGTGIRQSIRIYIDGDIMRDVIAYDCDAGWIMHIVHNDAGERVGDGENWIIRRLYGHVIAVMQDD